MPSLNWVSNPHFLPQSLLESKIYTGSQEDVQVGNEDDDENNSDHDVDVDDLPEWTENNVEHQFDDAGSASMDPGDDKDNGAVDGPPVSSYVDLTRRIGMY